MEVDGNTHLDFVQGLGPIILGYLYLTVDASVLAQMTSDRVFGLRLPVEVKCAELICEAAPCADLEGDLSSIIDRFADLVGISRYQQLLVLAFRVRECVNAVAEISPKYVDQLSFYHREKHTIPDGRLIQGDVLEELGNLDDESVDFVYAVPPYNLQEKYKNYAMPTERNSPESKWITLA